jgi:hypothetical protein
VVLNPRFAESFSSGCTGRMKAAFGFRLDGFFRISPHTLVASTRQPIQINTATRTEITTGVGFAAICRRWRTIPCGKNADEIHIPSQTERSVLLALSGLTARGVSILPRKRRSACNRQFAIGVRFDSRAFSSLRKYLGASNFAQTAAVLSMLP